MKERADSMLPAADKLVELGIADPERPGVFGSSVGPRWRPSESLTVDAGYAHLFVQDAAVDLTRGPPGAPAVVASRVVGDYDSAVNILSLQATWSM